MKKIVFLIIFLISINMAFAVNDRVKIKKCEIAFLRENISNWNDTEVNRIFNTTWNGETGNFVELTNNNLTIGEPSDYSYNYYSTERVWNNSDNSGGTTSLPILDVEDKESYIYLKCTYKMGDYRYFPTFSTIYLFNFMSTDFNVTPLITENLGKQTFQGNTYSKQRDAVLAHVWENNPYRNNFVPGEKGFFPNTEPYEVWKFDVKNNPSSLIYFAHYLIRDQGMVNIIDLGYNDLPWFYVEGKEDLERYLLPKRESTMIENEDTGEKTYQWGEELEVIPGQTYRYTVNYTNPYSMPIEGLTINHGYFFTNNLWCFDRGTLNPPGIIVTPFKSEIVDIAPGEIATITDSLTVPNDKLICHLETNIRLQSTSGSLMHEYPVIGSDATPYLSFDTLDTRIEPIDGKTSLVVDTELFVTDWKHNLPVEDGDYEIIARIYYDNFSNMVYEDIIPLNALKIAELTGGPAILPKGNTHFRWTLEVDPTWELGNYYVKLFSKAKTGRFKDQEIIMLFTKAYVKPGEDIQFPTEEGTTFYFYPNFNNHTKKILLFNPSYESQTYTITHNLTDIKNFSVDHITTVQMGPFETKEFTLEINATYTPWPFEHIIEEINISVETTEQGREPKEISYKLNILDQDSDTDRQSCADYAIKSINEINCEAGDNKCWVTNTDIDPAKNKSCCGDDYEECWLDEGDNACCPSTSGNITYMTDADLSQEYCNLLGKRPKNLKFVCGDKNKICWTGAKSNPSQCCGDEKDETWKGFRITMLDELPTGNCINATWRETKLYYRLTK